MSSGAIALLCFIAAGVSYSNALHASANPIRKVVSLMQNMQKEVEAQGEKEKELFDKFMCFCNGGDADLKAAAVKTAGEIKALDAKIKGETAEKSQLVVELKQHDQDKADATKDLAEADVMRTKESNEHGATVADLNTNMAGVARAIPALENGMGGAAFMQLPGSDRLAGLLDSFPFSDQNDRRHLLAFVQQSGDYVPASGQIVGILKGMKDTMEQQLKESNQEEASSVDAFKELKASKQQEVQIATEAIAGKTVRSGDLAVSVTEAKNNLGDAEEELADNERLAGQLKTQCATKTEEWDQRQKVRAQEVQAVSEAIKILNDDDSLDLFKKALPSPELLQNHGRRMAFLQRSSGKASSLDRVRSLLSHVASTNPSAPARLLLYTLNSKVKLAQKSGVATDFSDVISMIDDMVKLLARNQADDDSQRDYCKQEFHTSAGEKLKTERELEKVKVMIEERNDLVAQLVEDLANLAEDIKALDKSVAVATEQRKKEHEEYVQTAALSQAALELVDKAKNRLNKFYDPSMYKAAPTTTKSPSPYGFVQVGSSLSQAPETFGPTYEKGRQGGGIIMMMSQIVNDIELDMRDSKHDEQSGQKDYTELMNDSQQSRAQDSKSIIDKEAQKAKLQVKLEQNWERRRSTEDQLALVIKYIRDLHSKCDFLMKNFDERKEARTTESESLRKAKATLSGAGP